MGNPVGVPQTPPEKKRGVSEPLKETPARVPVQSSRRRPPPHGFFERLLAGWAALSLRRPWLLFLVGSALFLAAAPAAFKLYSDLRTDLRELLPRGAPAAVALDALEKRVGGFGHLSIIVDTPDLKTGEKFVDALAAALQKKLIPTLAREVRWRTDEDRAYLDAHGALYADVKDLEDLDDGLAAEIEKGKAKAAGFDLGLDDDPKEKEIDPRLDRVTKKLRARASEQDHFLDGYLAGEGGHTLVLLVIPPDGSLSLASNLRLFNAVAAEVKALAPPSIRVGYDGEVREVIEAQEHLVQDLEISSVLVLVAVGGVIVLFYRKVQALPVLVMPLFLGTTLTFAAGRAGIGYLNPNTAFLGSIIIGNGINAGIILFARYLEERRAGFAVADALPTAATTTWRATLTASGAAAASYACLGVTGFRGFNQFAFLGGLGMVLVWVSTYLFMPPLLVLFERLRPLVAARSAAPPPSTRAHGILTRPFSSFLSRFAAPVAAASMALTVASVALVARFARDPIEYDFSKLGSKQGARDGAGYWSKRLDAVMQSYQTPTMILTDSPESADAVKRAIVAQKEAEGKDSPIASASTLADVLPADQEQKLVILRRIMGRLTAKVMKAVPEESRAEVEKLRSTTQLRTVTLDDLPDHVRRLFKEKDGQTGRLVIVYPELSANSAAGRRQIHFARTLRATAEAADPRAEVAGSLILGADIIDSITRDGFMATGLSFLGVSLLTVLIIASWRDAAWVLGSLTMGSLWMGGALGLLNIKLNFVNFAVLPITFGIGVDYAVNLYERYRQLGPGGAPEAVATSGGAVALCSFTTIIGYSALLVADNQAIFLFGSAAVIGEIACLSAALIALPALLIVRDRRAARAEEPTPVAQ